jgi:hypothetical protein
VIVVLETTTKLVRLTPPKLAAVAPSKLVPVIVTAVPPAIPPVAGETVVIVGTYTSTTVDDSPQAS